MRFVLFSFFFSFICCKNIEHKESFSEYKPIRDSIENTSSPITSDTATVLPSKGGSNIPLSFDTMNWADIRQLDSTILLDIRYATENNFVRKVLYPCGKCLLRKEVANTLVYIHQKLKSEKQLGIKVYDCYRPHSVQWLMWKEVPDARYVANPKKGSVHNRGGAVDLTLVDSEGNELDMGTAYDYFGEEAYHTYFNHPVETIKNRTLLKTIMEENGFKSIRTEWWHYSYLSKVYEISDMKWSCE